jgi:hypothetical protein
VFTQARARQRLAPGKRGRGIHGDAR